MSPVLVTLTFFLVVPSKSSVTLQDTWAGVNRLGTGSVWVMRYASVAPVRASASRTSVRSSAPGFRGEGSFLRATNSSSFLSVGSRRCWR